MGARSITRAESGSCLILTRFKRRRLRETFANRSREATAKPLRQRCGQNATRRFGRGTWPKRIATIGDGWPNLWLAVAGGGFGRGASIGAPYYRKRAVVDRAFTGRHVAAFLKFGVQCL